MKSILSIALFIFVSASAVAQTSDSTRSAVPQTKNAQPVQYLLPDGKTIPATQLDSLLSSWNHQPFSMVHYDDKPGIIGLVPMTEAMKKQFRESSNKTGIMLNQPAPDFELNDIYGQHYRLSEMKGKVVVLNFWFTACAPCRAEMPLLDSVKKQSDPTKVIFLALALDNTTAVRQFLHAQSFDYSLLTNAGTTHTAYQVASCPTSMVIDKEGIIRFIQASGDEIDKKLTAAIQRQL